MGSDRNVCPVGLLNLVLVERSNQFLLSINMDRVLLDLSFDEIKNQFYLKSVHMSEINSVTHTYK